MSTPDGPVPPPRPNLNARAPKTATPRASMIHKFWKSMSEIDGPACSETEVKVCVAVIAATWPVEYVEVDADVETNVLGTFVTS